MVQLTGSLVFVLLPIVHGIMAALAGTRLTLLLKKMTWFRELRAHIAAAAYPVEELPKPSLAVTVLDKLLHCEFCLSQWLVLCVLIANLFSFVAITHGWFIFLVTPTITIWLASIELVAQLCPNSFFNTDDKVK